MHATLFDFTERRWYKRLVAKLLKKAVSIVVLV